jgi:hypothetical protein
MLLKIISTGTSLSDDNCIINLLEAGEYIHLIFMPKFWQSASILVSPHLLFDKYSILLFLVLTIIFFVLNKKKQAEAFNYYIFINGIIYTTSLIFIKTLSLIPDSIGPIIAANILFNFYSVVFLLFLSIKKEINYNKGAEADAQKSRAA